MCIRILNRYVKRHVSRHVFSSGSLSANETICLTIVESMLSFPFHILFFYRQLSPFQQIFLVFARHISIYNLFDLSRLFLYEPTKFMQRSIFRRTLLDSVFILTLLYYRLQFTDMHIIPYLNRDHNYILVTDFSYTE